MVSDDGESLAGHWRQERGGFEISGLGAGEVRAMPPSGMSWIECSTGQVKAKVASSFERAVPWILARRTCLNRTAGLGGFFRTAVSTGTASSDDGCPDRGLH